MVIDINFLALAQVHKSHDVTRLVVVVALVGNPHLDAGDLDTRRDERQPGAPVIIVVTEEMGQEEVAVLVILVALDQEIVGL